MDVGIPSIWFSTK